MKILANILLIGPLVLAIVVIIALPAVPQKQLEKIKTTEELKNSLMQNAGNYQEKLNQTERELQKYVWEGLKTKKIKIILELVTMRITNIKIFSWAYFCLAVLAMGMGIIRRQDKIRKSELISPEKATVSIASVGLVIGLIICYISLPAAIGPLWAILITGGAVYGWAYGVASQIPFKKKSD